MSIVFRRLLWLVVIACISTSAFAQTPLMPHSMRLFASLDSACTALVKEFSNISTERKQQLRRIADYIRQAHSKQATVRLTFICTHNSRRSHLAQIWAMAAAEYFGVQGVETFSGGTETTAFNPRAVAAMRRAGFRIESDASSETPSNPHYTVYLSEKFQLQHIFSKRYDDALNPHKYFAAVMVCSHAEAQCPFVAGAEQRFSLPYDDPKDFDGTAQETAKYDERVREIGRDLLWVMQNLR